MIPRPLDRIRFMREHVWTHRHLSEYLDDELAPADRDRIGEHVGLCPKCSRLLATLRRTVEGLHLLRPSTPPGLADGVIERLHDDR